MSRDLISREALLDAICKNGEYHGLTPAHRWNACRIVSLIPAVDAVLRDEHEALLRRFRHLLESDFIRSFDEVDPLTGVYKRNIAEADKAEPVRCRDCVWRGNERKCPMCHEEWFDDLFDGFDSISIDKTTDEGFCHCGARTGGEDEETERDQ